MDQQSLDFLAGQLANQFEGTRLHPYTDSMGKLTIGVGHNLTDKGITPNQAAQLLYDDLHDTVSFLDTHCSWWSGLDDVRQQALANMTFDLMSKILEFTGLLAALQTKNWGRAATEVLNSAFAVQTGQRAIDIANAFRNGTWQTQ